MSSTLVPAADGGSRRALLQLPRRLLVGIRVDGTLAAMSITRGVLHLRPRPHLSYIVKTLRALRCHVALVVAADGEHMTRMWREQLRSRCGLVDDNVDDSSRSSKRSSSRSRAATRRDDEDDDEARHDGPCLACTLVNELDVAAAMARHRYAVTETQQPRPRSTAAHTAVCPCDLTSHLSHLARAVDVSPSRVLLVDSELNYRATPSQILVTERYDLVTGLRRARREGLYALLPEQGCASRSTQRAVDAVVRIAQHSDFVQRQQCGPRHGMTDAHRRLHIAAAAAATADAAAVHAHTTPSSPSAALTTTTTSADSAADAVTMSSSSSTAALSRAPLPPDTTLLALACVLTRLATSRADVAQFLSASSLVDTMRVPNYGSAYYLASDRCAVSTVPDWDVIDVRGADAQTAAEATMTDAASSSL